MALNNAAVADIGFASLVGAESMKLHAYSAFTLLFMMNSGTDPKAIRKHLAVRAADTGVIAKNTWESYVKGVETAAGMFRQHAPDEVATIFDMGADDAVDAVRTLYEGLNILSGSDIRAWATAGVFEPLDKAAAKAAKAAAAKTSALAKGAGAAALFFAGNAADSSTISDMGGEAAPADPIAAIAALLAGLDEAATMKALEAVNARLAIMQAAKDAAPAPDKVAPVLADDATVAKLSSLGRVKHAA
ncbi:hypothetical protein [Methylorubrum populi]|uniref:hypothetical protein n=1 Tax=Methylorubrum populi TaxID=223967 RepID=UPI000DB58F15|nr:hypothetical protein [Methylorubrum populi]PZP71788.1 MAG: hypothetical protein DI590_05875 [Methylorubrum populi]